MAMWVQLLKMKMVHTKGEGLVRKNAGDWVEVGRQTALQWIAAGEAHTPDPDIRAQAVGYTAGIIYRGRVPEKTADILSKGYAHLTLQNVPMNMPLELDFTETLYWNTDAVLRLELMDLGFHQLRAWQMAVPLLDYDILATNIGSDEDRERTQEVILDLRVPVYDTRLMYIARCQQTKDLVALWYEEYAEGGDERLAFLRAMWQVKPVICALPITWTDKTRVRVG